MLDGEAFGTEIVDLVRGYVEREIAPLKAENESLRERLAALEARPAPEKGEKGDPGESGADGKDGADGANGKDGAGIVDGFVSRDGHLIATLSDGTTRDFGEIIGKDGADGKDGRDGFGFDDMDACVLDDDRTIELSFRRGDEEKCFTFKWPTVIYRGVWAEAEYSAGDAVTWGGSVWIAEKDTSAKPDTADGGWRLAVKKGRDGKNG
jgi:integrin beta 3